MPFLVNIIQAVKRFFRGSSPIPKGYDDFLQSIKNKGIVPSRVCDVARLKQQSFCMIIHKVLSANDKFLPMARLEHSMGIKATYLMRGDEYLPDRTIRKALKNINHEIAYHYENISYIKRKYKPNRDSDLRERAWWNFRKNMNEFREVSPVFFIMAYNPDPDIDNGSLICDYHRRDQRIRADIGKDMRYLNAVWIDCSKHEIQADYLDEQGKRSPLEKSFTNLSELIEHFNTHEYPDRVIFEI